MQTEDRPLPKGGLIKLVPMVVLPMYLGVVDQTIVSTALPDIAARLGHVQYISWIVVGYLTAATIAAPVYGRFGDVFGRRRLLVVALCIYMLASLFCSLAVSMEMLILGRVLQGLGGGGMITLSQALIGESVPPRVRARLNGHVAAIAMTSNGFGPVLGGYLTYSFGWETVFLVNLPLGLLALVVTLRSTGLPGHGERRPFDFLGLGLLALFVASVLIGFSRASSMTPSALLEAGAMLALGVLSLLLLLRHELRTPFPLLPIKLMRTPVIWRANGLVACHGASFVGMLTFLPVYLGVVRGVSLADIGWLLLPVATGVGVGSLATAQVTSRTGLTAIFPSVGLTISTALMVAIALLLPGLGNLWLSVLLGLCAVCLGTVMGVVQVTVQIAAGPRVLGAAAATVQLSRSVGAALGTGLVGLVLFGTLSTADSGVLDLFRRLVQEGPGFLDGLDAATRAGFASAVGGAFVGAFLVISVFMAIGAALAWAIPMRRI